MRVVEWRMLDIPLSGSLLSCCCQYLFFISMERWQCCHEPDDSFEREHLRVY
jgi:hypothetical protein